MSHCSKQHQPNGDDGTFGYDPTLYSEPGLSVHLRSGGSRTLVKACSDPWQYAIGLRTGAIITYERAELRGQWLWLAGAQFLVPRLDIETERGVEVRVDEIAWSLDEGH